MAFAKYVGGGGGARRRGAGRVEREGEEGGVPGAGGGAAVGPALRVRVQFGERHDAWCGELRMGREDSVASLKRKLWRVHGIPPHQQVLRLGSAAGELLREDAQTLPAAGVEPGVKVMLLGHAGLFPGTGGGGAGRPEAALGLGEARSDSGTATGGQGAPEGWQALERACAPRPAGGEVGEGGGGEGGEEAREAELRRRGNDHFREGDFAEAARLYSEALGAQGGQRHLAHSNRAACRLALDDAQGALADAKEAVTLCPTFVRGFLRLGDAYARLGRWNEARFAFQQGLRLEPQNPALLKGAMEAATGLRREK